jgi:hypothetical protein
MCDYSLHAVQSRPARAGDVLLTGEFPNTVTRGFAAIGEPDTAVCLLPGTELAFSEDAVCDHPFAKLYPQMRFGSIGARLARFRQINRGSNSHHDALEFANGKIVLLTKLRPGQRATVLQLPAQREIDGKPLTAEQNQRSSVSRKGGEFACRSTPVARRPNSRAARTKAAAN